MKSNQPTSSIPFATPRISSLVEDEVAAGALHRLAEATIGNMPAENYYQFDHGKNWNCLQYDEDGKAREILGEMQLTRAQVCIPQQSITGQKTDLIEESMNSIFSGMGNQVDLCVYEKIKENAEQCGLTFEIPPSGISIEQYFGIISKCPFSISKTGELNRPLLFNIPPHLQEKLQFDLDNAPQEFKARLADLLAKKEAEARRIEEARLARFDSTE